MNHLLALLEDEDSAYISLEDLVSEIHALIGDNQHIDTARQVLLAILRKENREPTIYQKDIKNGWIADKYSHFGETISEQIGSEIIKKFRETEALDGDLPF